MDTTMWAGVMGLVGALIGGFATYLVGRGAVSAQNKRDADAEIAQLRATLKAIRDEVIELTDVHMSSGGSLIDDASVAKPIEMFYPIASNYFTAFEANADQIGRVVDDELRSQIIRTYVHFKALFDSIRLNNHYVERLERAEAVERASLAQHVETAKKETHLHWMQTADYTPKLKQANSRAMRSSAELVIMVDQWLAESSAQGVGAKPLR